MSTLWMFATVAVLILAALWIFGTLMERSRGVRFRAGWTCGVVGLRGGGKSLFVARVVASRLAEGRNVVGNLNFTGCERMTSWEDVILAPSGTTVVLDEAHQWARATAGKSPDPLADWYVSHARKLGHELWWIAQHETQVASFVRNQTNEMVSCEEYIAGRHRARSYGPHDFRKAKARPLWSWWYTPKGAATRVYDTFELAPPVVSDRDTAEVKKQKYELVGLIATINARRASLSDVGSPETIRKSAAFDFANHGDGLSNDDADDNTPAP